MIASPETFRILAELERRGITNVEVGRVEVVRTLLSETAVTDAIRESVKAMSVDGPRQGNQPYYRRFEKRRKL